MLSVAMARFSDKSYDMLCTSGFVDDVMFSPIQIGFTFLVPAHLGSPGQNPRGPAVLRLCVCVCVMFLHNGFRIVALWHIMYIPKQ